MARMRSTFIPEYVRAHATTRPDAPAVGDLTYGRLDAWTDQVVGTLLDWGIRPGARVATRLGAGPEFVVVFLALMRAGAVTVPLAVSSTGWDREVLIDSPPGIVVVSADCSSESTGWAAAEDRRPVPPFDPSRPALNSLGSNYIRPPWFDMDAPCYTVFTSGSTGRPKAVTQSHRAFTDLVCWMVREFRLAPPVRWAQWASTHYDASLCEIAATLVAGGTVVPLPDEVKYDARLLVNFLAEEDVHVLQTVPSFTREILHALDNGSASGGLPPLSCLLLTGEPLPGDLAAALQANLPATRLINLYGPTETILATWMEVPEARSSGTVPVGRAIPGYRVFVVDGDDRLCDDGSVGEIVICAPFLPDDYAAGGDADGAARFGPLSLHGVAEALRCYRTGDLGRWRNDGLLEWCGRADRQVKLRGTRVEPTEIESAAIEHPAVVDCVVVGVAGTDGLVDFLVAYVAAGPNSVSAGEIREHLRRRLDADLMPSEFVVLPALPRNSGGKVDLARLPRPAH
ncbi:AMP-binding protein [Nocardia sp. NPDC005745]|uniref:AMP-binding protein n=1 Tax=Nocardia sp. NPDC005745 TaxID=3157061 RepID=UPI0033DB75B5